MDFSTVKKITIPEGEVKQISVGGTVIWKSGPTNLVPLSTEADGKTIYNGGLGYKDGYRVRSGGAEAAQGFATCSGFIPAVGGDEIGFTAVVFDLTTTANAINVYDSSFTNLGQIVENHADRGYGIFADGTVSNWKQGAIRNGCFYWKVPSGQGIAYVRVTARMDGNGKNMVVTKNEEIT